MPICECHGKPMRWHKDARRSAGGTWRCRENDRAAHQRYEKSDKGRERQGSYEETRIRVRIPGVSDESFRIPAEKKSDLQATLADFRLKQRKEKPDGRIS